MAVGYVSLDGDRIDTSDAILEAGHDDGSVLFLYTDSRTPDRTLIDRFDQDVEVLIRSRRDDAAEYRGRGVVQGGQLVRRPNGQLAIRIFIWFGTLAFVARRDDAGLGPDEYQCFRGPMHGRSLMVAPATAVVVMTDQNGKEMGRYTRVARRLEWHD